MAKKAETPFAQTGYKIKKLREKVFGGRGGQKKFAEALGILQASVSQYESGMHMPDPERIKEMARIFGVPISYLSGVQSDEPEGRLVPYKNMEMIEELIKVRALFCHSIDGKISAMLSGRPVNPDYQKLVPVLKEMLAEFCKDDDVTLS